jgi:hypothetical protein
VIDALYTAAAPALRAWIDGNHARVVAVSQLVDKRRGGGSPMLARKLTTAQTNALNLIERYGDLTRTETGSREYWLVNDFSTDIPTRVANSLLEMGVIERDDTRSPVVERERHVGKTITTYYRRRADTPVSAPAVKPAKTAPALDAAHAAVLQAFRIEAGNPYRAPRLDFGPVTVRGMMRRWGFPDDVTYAVVHKDTPGISRPPRFHHPAQIKAARDTLVAEGLIEPDETDTYGRVKAWTYAGRLPGTLDRGPSGRVTPAIAHAEAGAKEVGTQFYKAALAKLVAELAPVRA